MFSLYIDIHKGKEKYLKGNLHQIINHKGDTKIKILEALRIQWAVNYSKKPKINWSKFSTSTIIIAQ